MISIIETALASFAIVYILRYTDGPFDVFLLFRRWVGVNRFQSPNGEVEEIADTVLAKLFGCFWCICTWVSLILVLVVSSVKGVSLVVEWFAVVGIAGFMHEIIAVRN